MTRARTSWGVGAVVAVSLLFAVALAGAPALASIRQPSIERIALVEHGNRVSSQALARAAAILTYQVNRQVRRFWPGPQIEVAPVRGRVPASWGMIELTGARSPKGTGGLHTTGAHGRLLAVIYLQRWGRHWTVGASHELLEMLQDPIGDTESSDYLEEICDPVQFVWYRLQGAYVSDFVTPSWYAAGPGPWDTARQLRAPRTFGPGGEEDHHTAAGWAWIGPGAVEAHYPKPLRVRRIPRR